MKILISQQLKFSSESNSTYFTTLKYCLNNGLDRLYNIFDKK